MIRRTRLGVTAAGIGGLVVALGALVGAQQPKIRTLTEQEIMDMTLGSSIQRAAA